MAGFESILSCFSHLRDLSFSREVPAAERNKGLANSRGRDENKAITAQPVATIGDEIALIALPPSTATDEERAMTRRRRFKPEASLQDRIVDWAQGVRAEADAMLPGPERDELLKKLQQAETAMHLNHWASSPGLQPPK